MNPLARLFPSIATALSGLVYDTAEVPVYELQPTGESAYYILLTAPKILETSGRVNCRQWLCEVVIIPTTLLDQGAVNGEIADDLAEAILTKLDGYRLPLPDRWDCLPGQLVLADDEASDDEQERATVVRRLRFQWLVTYHGPAPAVAPTFVRATTDSKLRTLTDETTVRTLLTDAGPRFLAFFKQLFSTSSS